MAGIIADCDRIFVIGKYRQRLIDSTNINESPEEMKVLNDLMFRLYQMGWLAVSVSRVARITTEDQERNSDVR